MIVIISDNKNEKIGNALYQYYQDRNEDVEFVAASDLNIKPCYGCDGCTYKTYGKCIFRDDMDYVLPLLMKGDTIIYTSPMVWGGFSYSIKKIIDKMALTGDRFYHVKKGELVKGTISNMKKIIGISTTDKASEKEEKTFESYIKEIATIIDVKYMGKVVNTTFTDMDIERIAMEVNKL